MFNSDSSVRRRLCEAYIQQDYDKFIDFSIPIGKGRSQKVNDNLIIEWLGFDNNSNPSIGWAKVNNEFFVVPFNEPTKIIMYNMNNFKLKRNSIPPDSLGYKSQFDADKIVKITNGMRHSDIANGTKAHIANNKYGIFKDKNRAEYVFKFVKNIISTVINKNYVNINAAYKRGQAADDRVASRGVIDKISTAFGFKGKGKKQPERPINILRPDQNQSNWEY